MSRIYPERLPENVLHDPKRAAERAMYEALRQPEELNTRFRTFLYSRVGDKPAGRVRVQIDW